MDEKTIGLYFRVFNEIGIIGQLSRARLDKVLPDGLIEPHFAVLNHLIRVQDGRTPLELARAFQVAKTTMTHTLSGLAKHGLVDIRPNPNDKRSKLVWLRPEGRAMRDKAIQDLSVEYQGLVEAIPPEHFAALLPLLEDLRIYLDNNRNT